MSAPRPDVAPLDLHAIEALSQIELHAPGYIELQVALRALLAALRETRAALQPFAEAAKGVLQNMDDDLNLDRQFAAGDLRRAAAVLDKVRDA